MVIGDLMFIGFVVKLAEEPIGFLFVPEQDVFEPIFNVKIMGFEN
jgi:hypothetical protein